jgi:hypothetical protein
MTENTINNGDDLMLAAEVAKRASEKLGRRVTPTAIGQAARRGRLPIAARQRSGVMLFTDAAVRAYVNGTRAREVQE